MDRDQEQARLRLIEERAYLRFEARGRTDGYALEDWLAAEDEVRRAHAAKVQETVSSSAPVRSDRRGKKGERHAAKT